MDTTDDEIVIRSPNANDANFILATWLRGLYYGCEWFHQVPKHIFMEEYHKILVALLSSPNTTTRMACLRDDQDVIVGYSVTSTGDTALHWIFVKTGWRKLCVAKRLVPNSITSVSHLTKVGLDILRKYPDLVFNPFRN
jgi:hypothetical protein